MSLLGCIYLERILCKKCGKELLEEWNHKLCEECREKKKGFIKKVFFGIVAVGMIGVTVASVLRSSTSRDDDDHNMDNDYTGDDESIEYTGAAKQHPLLPAKAYLWLYDHWGRDAAHEVLGKVQNGEMSVEQVEKAINRPDIDPEDWREFEEGWRPLGW